MDIEDQFSLEHLLFLERKCRSCGRVKNLLDDFYLTRRERMSVSAYSYECKDCTIERIKTRRKRKQSSSWEYPDW